MHRYVPATLGIAAVLMASTALAKERSALESASVKAASDCDAAAALKDPNIVTLYRENRLKEVTNRIVLRSSACDSPLTAMRLLHDRLYGAGTGRTFLLGDYLADLPRAVGERIAGEVVKRIASESGDDAAKGYAMHNGLEDRGTCYNRVYTREHLAKQPDQLVTSMRLQIVPDGGFALHVTRRGSDDVLGADGACKQKSRGLLCTVDGKDGGSFRVVPTNGRDVLLYIDDRIRVSLMEGEGDDPGVWLSAGKSDDVLRLNRVAERVCRGMYYDEDPPERAELAPEYKACHTGDTTACKRWRVRACRDGNPAACDY